MSNLFEELKRRKVVRVTGVYAVEQASLLCLPRFTFLHFIQRGTRIQDSQ